MSHYITTLLREIAATPRPDHSPPLETVFFGGGTPSLLSVAQVETILNAIDQRFGIATTAEISMEMDPATFERSHIQGYKNAGVNRISLGAQAFQSELLSAAGRFHRRADILQAASLIHQTGIENFSLDLISGLPNQTIEDWQDSLEQAIALAPTHLSIYDLVVEPQTAFDRYFTPGEAPLPSDQVTAEMYNMAYQFLTERGYDHYEICNFAKPGYEARHNLTYWRCEFNYGFGMGATSYINHQRIDRPRTQKTYQDWVSQFIANGGKTEDTVLPKEEQVMETIMMGLRLAPGISMAQIYAVYRETGLRKLESAIAPHIQNQWVIVSNAQKVSSNITNLEPGSRIRLSDPKGFLMSNVVITDAFNALESVKPANSPL